MGNDSIASIKSNKVLLSAFGPKFCRLLQDEIIRLNYPFEVVQAIHDFSLSGACNFNSIHAKALLMAANDFNIIGIKVQAGLHLVEPINIANAHEMYNLSLELCVHTRSNTKQFILENFEELGQNDDFLKNCKTDWMSEFIKEDTLNACEEMSSKSF